MTFWVRKVGRGALRTGDPVGTGSELRFRELVSSALDPLFTWSQPIFKIRQNAPTDPIYLERDERFPLA